MGKNGGGVAKNVLYKKQCKCIGSIAIPQQFRNDAQLFINDKFEEMKDVVKGIPVVVMVTDEGVKILRDNDESVVRMAHGVPKILFSTCQPERKLFAYVAKARTADRKSVLQVHLFRTKRTSHTKELNASLSKAFKLFAEKATVERKEVMKSFDVETPENRNPEIRGKRWAKHEISRGHQNSGHAQLAQQRVSQVAGPASPSSSGSPSGSSTSSSPIPPNASLSEPKNLQKRSTPPKKMSKQHTLNDNADRIRTVYGSPQNSLSFSESESEKIASASDSSECSASETHSSSNKVTENSTEKIIDEKPRTPRLQREDECDEVEDDELPEMPARITSAISRDDADILDISCDDASTSANKARTIATPAQRFSTVIEPSVSVDGSVSPAIGASKPPHPHPLGNMANLQISESSFEGYVNVVDKSMQPLPPLPDDDTTVRESQLFEMSEEDILRNAEWFQEGFSRDVAESVLADRSIGAFFVRSSQTKVGNFALTVKIPTNIKENGVGNFLIEHADDKYHLKGFTTCFSAVSDLVAHYGSCKEDLPVQLRLMCSNNTLYKMKSRANSKDTIDCKPRSTSNGASIGSNNGTNGIGNSVGGKGVEFEEEEEDEDNYTDIDYLRYTSADEMMRELAEL